jgi:dTMP kinase
MLLKQPLEFYSEPLAGVDTEELQGKLIVIEGPDSVGRSTQVARLRAWLEHQGHAVLDTGLARGALAGKGISQAKEGNLLGPITMTLFYATDFADRMENEIIPALRAGFVVLTDRYIFSLMARAIARGEDRTWIEKVASFALVPHAVYYLRAEVRDLLTRVVLGRGAFDHWESGMTCALARICTIASCAIKRASYAPSTGWLSATTLLSWMPPRRPIKSSGSCKSRLPSCSKTTPSDHGSASAHRPHCRSGPRARWTLSLHRSGHARMRTRPVKKPPERSEWRSK